MRQPKSITPALVFSAAVALLAVAGCGNVTTSRESARDQATTVSCDWYQMCGAIGPGKTHETRASCEVSVKGYWEGQWTPPTCDGKINVNELDICLSAIHSTDCTALLEILNTLGNKCAAVRVCAPSSTDASAG
jgi:hypothetical protein